MESVSGLNVMPQCIIYTISRTGDGDSTDLVKDLVVMKRRYQGTIEVFGILFYTATGT